MFKLEFDPSNTFLAMAMGKGLIEYATIVAAAATANNTPAPATANNTPAPVFLGELQTDDGPFRIMTDTPLTAQQHAMLSDKAREQHTGPIVEAVGGGSSMLDIPEPDGGVANGPDIEIDPASEEIQLARIVQGTPATATDVKVDLRGVPFCDLHCAVAAKPFYASGPRENQWKKKHKVTDAAYDAWYAGELLAAEVKPATPPDTTVDSAAAFANTTAPAPDAPVPTDLGAFMAWFSEMQTAGRLTQDQLGNAYAVCNVTMADLCAPNTDDVVAHNIKALHTNLSVMAA